MTFTQTHNRHTRHKVEASKVVVQISTSLAKGDNNLLGVAPTIIAKGDKTTITRQEKSIHTKNDSNTTLALVLSTQRFVSEHRKMKKKSARTLMKKCFVRFSNQLRSSITRNPTAKKKNKKQKKKKKKNKDYFKSKPCAGYRTLLGICKTPTDRLRRN